MRLDEEIRAIQRRLDGGRGERFDLRLELAVRRDDLPYLLMRYRPQVVHFAGHGAQDGGILLQDDRGHEAALPPDVLAKYFGVLNDGVRCVVLNSCYGMNHAADIAKFVPCVVAMQGTIPDVTAIRFARGFYEALADGKSLGKAFELAKLLISAARPEDSGIPQVIWAEGVEPNQLRLVSAEKPDLALSASFEMKKSKPKSESEDGLTYYRLWLQLENLPRGASLVTYLYHDPTFEQDIEECTNIHNGFRTYLDTFGDFDVGVIVFTGRRGRAFKTTLGDALDRHYGPHPAAEIAAAIANIKAN